MKNARRSGFGYAKVLTLILALLMCLTSCTTVFLPNVDDTTDTKESGESVESGSSTEKSDGSDTLTNTDTENDSDTESDSSTVTSDGTDAEDTTVDGGETEDVAESTTSGGPVIIDPDTGSEDSSNDSEESTTNNGSSEDTTTEEVTTKQDEPLEYPTVNVADYKGVFISRVYGNGGKSDAAAEHSFVELYNSTGKTVSLFGLSLYCKSSGGDPFAQFPFPKDAKIAPGGYYLVRGEAAKQYDNSFAILSVNSYDAEWNYSIDNNEYRLMLAPVGLVLPKTTDVLTHGKSISAIITIPDGEYHSSVYAVDNMSKNKVAVRTALEEYSGFHKINLAELSSTELVNNAPRCSRGIAENARVTSRLTEVTFSMPAGIYTNNIKVTLTAPEGYTIYYTMNGEDPSTGTSRVKYTQPLNVRDGSETDWTRGKTIPAFIESKGTAATPTVDTMMAGKVIKAYATNGTDSTPVYTSTYFVLPELADLDVTVMSMSIPVDEFVGTNGFYTTTKDGLLSPRPRGLATMEVFDENGVRVGYSNVEAAISGHGSSGWGMKSMRLYWKGANNIEGGLRSDLDYDLFDGRCTDVNGQAITSFSRLLLRNAGNDSGGAMFRDAYAQLASAQLNVDYMEYEPVFLFVNGEFWGVYNARERYSGEYVESHYGVDKDNVTILENDYYEKVYNNNNIQAPYILSSGLEADATHFNELYKFIRTNDMTNSANYEYVCSQLDIDSLIGMYISRIFFDAPDWPDNNIKIWRNRNAADPSGTDTKWHFTLLDLDFCLTTDAGTSFSKGINLGSVCSTIVYHLVKNENFKNKFITDFHTAATQLLTEENNLAILDELYAERLVLMPYIVERWGNEGRSVGELQTEVTEMRGELRGRNAAAINELKSFFGLSNAQLESITGKSVAVTFNPTRLSVKINGSEVSNGDSFTFTGTSKTYSVVITPKNGYEYTGATVTFRNGTTLSYTKTQFSFQATMSGTLTVNAKRTTSNNVSIADGTFVAGASYMFYLSPDGDLYGWGDNTHGVLGAGASAESVPTPQFIMGNVKKVSTTDSANYEQGSTNWATAILTNDGKLYTVGCNGSGQLGRNGTNDSYELGLVSFNGAISDVSMGFDHMLVVDDKGNLYGIGNNNYGQLGADNVDTSVSTFQKIATGVKFANASRRTTVYVTASGDMYGLGDNRWKKINQTDTTDITTPYFMLGNVKFIDAGEHQILVITEDGALYYAGWRTFSGWSTGNGNTPSLYKVANSGVVDADIYYDNMVVLKDNGDVYVYGANTGAALGASATGGTLVKSTLINNVVDVAAGYAFTAYLTSDGSIFVQGTNTHGQGGNGQLTGTLNMSEIVLDI
ncbi:MAG: hypothetical protein E7589_02390 [Ruminococcaceae bacterium]|nr:hypothetical protein [Oscillospiraceae bacterium]